MIAAHRKQPIQILIQTRLPELRARTLSAPVSELPLAALPLALQPARSLGLLERWLEPW
jgi:hypothetical protein